ncbi:laccase-1-like [Apis dorsata]|uniref:laccase-1-like n=1 Tax=Apis dorsata TaxID=7462 RepID=UPI0003DF6FDE|nr:laccase-1-like [Apis dorsata]
MTGRKINLYLLEFFLLLHNCLSETVITVHNDFEIGSIDPETADELDWTKHPCRRNCIDEAPPMQCHYIFRLEAYHTMSKACYDCPFNITDCFRKHCIPADGIERSILVVNRQMPGPAIEVCQGDRITVDVINLLHSESTTMHWHGQHHVKTPYMDGVPYVSQCPILPGSTFRYDFIATEAGTHFWHSHSGFQRGDGVFGPLIVRTPPKVNWHNDLYDIDKYIIQISDWTHELGIDKFLNHHHAGGDNKPPNILINGLGRFTVNRIENNISAIMPTAIFTVKQNVRYRFRLINAEFLNCPIELSIDNHTMRVISSDGRDIEAIEAESLVSYAGERFDFVVEANQNVDNFWIRFRGLMDCDERFTKAYQVAILRYEGATNKDPNELVGYKYKSNYSIDGQRINALNEGTETNNSISIPLLKAMDKNDKSNIAHPDYQFYVSYDFYKKDNPHFHRGKLYGFNQVKNTKRVLTPQLNHISMKLPPMPLLSQRDFIDSDQFCNSSTVQGCIQDYCACTHVLQVNLDSVVEIILVDEGFAYDANHPFHLHGYQFRVIAMERVGENVTVDKVKALDKEGAIRRNLDHAPLKDTVTVPDGGYTVVRFHANNPGYWLFHCHIEFHAEVGMSLIFKVGEHKDMLPVPRNFPLCGNWQPEDVQLKSSSLNILSNTVKKSIIETSNVTIDEITENSIKRFIKVLPEVLKTLQISSSAISVIPYSLFSFYSFIAIIYTFI